MVYIVAILGLLVGHLHADEGPASVVLKGKVVMEDGAYFLVLDAPLAEAGKTIEKVKIENPTPEVEAATGNVMFLFGTRTSASFTVARVLQTDAPPSAATAAEGSTINQFQTGNFFTATVANSTTNTVNVRENNTVNLSSTTVNISQPAGQRDNLFVGRWATHADPGGLSASALGITISANMAAHLVIDLGRDGQASLTVGPEGGTLGDGIIGMNVVGEWFVTRNPQGKTLLFIRPRELFGQRRLTKIIDRDIGFYVLHASENSMVLSDESGMRFVMSRR